ncbi:MAG: Gfo/Idh/MocA family oxidoreductase [Bacteroidales bacterium]|nr:Gfo/Idh/MocA family oxidoreductase [Bacteroidales bacterium]
MNLNRRDFIKKNAVAGIGLAVAPTLISGTSFGAEKIKLGFVGVGGRGSWLLRLALEHGDVIVPAVCDIREEAAERAGNMVVEAGQDQPKTYTDGNYAFEGLVERDDLDGVVIATPWIWHTKIAVATMKSDKYAAVEVPAATTLEECWDLVKTSEETGMPCMMLENVCYRRDVMAILNMVRQGMFGEMVHGHCGYQHDLRGVKFNPGAEFGKGANGEARWRTEHSIHRNGDIYPTHGVGPIANYFDINRGNRFVYLTSMATKTRGLHEYIVAQGGEDHPNADIRFKLGDIVTTLIKCANEETIMISHDTNLPRPYSLGFRVQGTKGLWMKDGDQIYIEGISEPHTWESSGEYLEKYDHPLWKRYEDKAAGSGHGGMDFFVMHAFIESVKRQVPTPLDVYDAAAWSVISPLSEQSVASGGEPQYFPDFTAGMWMKRVPEFAMNDEF